MNLWLQAIHLLCSSKKGISSNQLHRTLGVTLKTAWFMSHRIREAMRSGVAPILRENIAKEARLMTDEASHYLAVGREFAEHGVVKHKADEYVRGDAYTNTVEGYFSVFKRGMKGTHQHCAKKHLHRYLAEFDFRYNNRVANGTDDRARSDIALIGASGKRLKYQDS